MSDAPTDDLRPAAAAFLKSAGPKMETVLPHRTAVLELRSKGASFALIARLLEHIGVNVSTDTLRRLCKHPPFVASDTPVVAGPMASVPDRPTAPAMRPNASRGPRIADPRGQ